MRSLANHDPDDHLRKRLKKKENSITSGIEKFLTSFKTKEIKPLHLDRYEDSHLANFGRNGWMFDMQSYNNLALNRFTNLFLSDTKLKLYEVDEANMGLHNL